jgi:uncharacterized membrane protein YeaQ/YmgE (transglycosylase-associated protein family)
MIFGVDWWAVLGWIIFGAIVGWIASIIMGRNDRQGCLMNVIVGIIGAFIGGAVMGLLTQQQFSFGFNCGSFIVAILGAIVLLLIVGWFQRRRASRA